MLSGKQRRHLRALGHPLTVTVQLGRGGLSEGVIAATARALLDHELVKIKILEGAGLERHQAAEELARATGSEVAQVLGNTALLYRPREENPEIVLP